jgi:hypothetical protein
MRIHKLIAAGCVAASIFVSTSVVAKGGGHSGASHARSSSVGEHAVSGYTTSRGTYVAPHYQTNPNSTRNDNYSTRGNVNPHTGEAGTKPRDGEAAPY